MTHVKQLIELWLKEANALELKAIQADSETELSLQLRLRAHQYRMFACQLEIALVEDELEAAGFTHPILDQTPARNN